MWSNGEAYSSEIKMVRGEKGYFEPQVLGPQVEFKPAPPRRIRKQRKFYSTYTGYESDPYESPGYYNPAEEYYNSDYSF